VNTRTAYDNWSETYDRDRNLTRDLDHTVTQAAFANLRFSSVLEIGCGTGKNTALLASVAAKVHALDFSDGMLAQAKTKVLSDNVTFTVADLTRPWPCAAQSADLVVCNLVLEHIGDLSFVFAEAARVLVADGKFFVCELHPFRQYQGAQARFQTNQAMTEIPAFVHHLSDFTTAADANGLVLERFREWWHEEDQDKPPRLASFMFRKPIETSVVTIEQTVWMD
jgi:ubiquinone/menaquinone biosynthesis C-methylase UbiE